MPIRDLLLTVIVVGALPAILVRPTIGVLMWSWIGYMNPHRLVWGFAESISWAQIVGITTLVGLLFAPGDKRLPRDGIVYVLIAFNIWMLVTTFFAIYPDAAWIKWEKVFKIQLMTFVTLMLIKDRFFLHALIWVVTLSIGFYGIKGGIFTLATGGNYQVLGPEGTFFEGNTTLALALLMVLPLMRYLQLQSTKRAVRWAMLISMALTAISILGTYSRGALLGAIAMGIYLVWKSRYKAQLIVVGMLVLVPVLMILPQQWYERMESIEHYEEDVSAMGRIRAWQFTGHLIQARPLFGGGFEPYTTETYFRYAPDIAREAKRHQGPHSNYFKALGEHGYIGLFLYLATGILGFRKAGWIIRHTRDRDDLKWASDLAAMIQVSFVGYAVSGAFLGMTYFDLYYHLLAVLVLMPIILKPDLETQREPARALGPSGLPPQPVTRGGA